MYILREAMRWVENKQTMQDSQETERVGEREREGDRERDRERETETETERNRER